MEPEILKDFRCIGMIIREHRLAGYVTQAELANKLKVSKTRIYRLEHGDNCVSKEVLKECARILEFDYCELLKEPEAIGKSIYTEYF